VKHVGLGFETTTGSIFEVLDVGSMHLSFQNIIFYLVYTPDYNTSCPGLSLRLRLPKSEPKPEPTASPCQGPARLGLERAQLGGLRA